jgi:hypothetical protein
VRRTTDGWPRADVLRSAADERESERREGADRYRRSNCSCARAITDRIAMLQPVPDPDPRCWSITRQFARPALGGWWMITRSGTRSRSREKAVTRAPYVIQARSSASLFHSRRATLMGTNIPVPAATSSWLPTVPGMCRAPYWPVALHEDLDCEASTNPQCGFLQPRTVSHAQPLRLQTPVVPRPAARDAPAPGSARRRYCRARSPRPARRRTPIARAPRRAGRVRPTG